MAEFNGSSTLNRSVAQLLETSGDPAAIAALLPGCEALHRTDAEHIEGRLATEVAGIPVTAAVSVRRTVEGARRRCCATPPEAEGPTRHWWTRGGGSHH